MKKFILIFAIIAATVNAMAQSLSVSGVTRQPVIVTPEISTGLSAVIVVENTAGATVSYTSTTGHVTWQRFDMRGGGFAVDVDGVTRQGNTFSVAASAEDVGYIIDDGSHRTCYWVVNYANHVLELSALDVDIEQSDCDRTVLTLSGNASPIIYYTVNGRAVELSRDMHLIYRTLEFADDAWQQTEKDIVLPSVNGHISVFAPYCDTDFALSGDRFLMVWNSYKDVVSPYYRTMALTAETTATQTPHDADNESKTGNEGDLGGSAPAEITFTAYPTDAAVFNEWQFSNTEDFDDVRERFNETSITRTFTDEGTVYARFVCADASGKCTYYGQTYVISIGSSRLDCPNAFSPHNQDGINDEWKVSYSSIISFECDIFNRWGQRMAHLIHPSQGWDGRHNGKFVPAGVYFYVIKAKGADGRNYNKSGDINIVNSRKGSSPVATE